MSSIKCMNPWDVQSKHIMDISGISETLYSGECRYGGGEAYVCYEKVVTMNERQISMMVTEDAANTIAATDYKGVQLVCYENRQCEVSESVGSAE